MLTEGVDVGGAGNAGELTIEARGFYGVFMVLFSTYYIIGEVTKYASDYYCSVCLHA